MIIGKNIETGEEVKIDLEKFIDTRGVLTASSGQGKSWLIRKILQESFGKVQQVILDWEGEYSNLREGFDYLLVGKEGEIPISIQTAEIIAKKIMELSVSTIIDLSDLPRRDRIIFVKRFLDSLLNLPKELYNHLLMLFIDEAHQLAPQKGNCESLNSVSDAMSTGRKRGIGTTLCTQRIAKLNKDCVAEARNGAYGGMGLLEDRKRACEELGFNTKELEQSIKNLEPGEFYIFGSAISKEVIRVKIGDIKIKPIKVGSKGLGTITKTPDAIKKILSELKDLPQQAQQEFKDKEEMRKEISRLRQELTISKRNNITKEIKVVDEVEIEKAEKKGFKEAEVKFSENINFYKKENSFLKKENDNLNNIMKTVGNFVQKAMDIPKRADLPEPEKPEYRFKEKTILRQKDSIIDDTKKNIKKREPIDYSEKIKLRAGAMKMLNWLAGVYPDELSKQRLATLSGFSVKGGTFNTYISELKRNGWIEGNDKLKATEEGLNNSNAEEVPTGIYLLELWKGKFREGTGKILQFVYDKQSTTKEEIGENTGFSIDGGTFNTYLSELRRNGLIEIEGQKVKISEEFF